MSGLNRWRRGLAAGVVSVALLVIAPIWAEAPGAADLDSEETLREQAMARAEEQVPAPALKGTTLPLGEQVTHPLFIGVDDVTVPSYVGNPATNEWLQAFVGFQVWGAAYDEANDKIYFNNGSTLYEWPVGGTVTNLGTITDPGGATQSMVSLAFFNGTLYATKNIANEAVYAIDTTTRIATVVIDYVDADFDFGGLAADPNTGELYATNDDTSPHGSGLFRINLDGTGTLIAPYPAGQTDIDGLAVSDSGYAYLVIDEPGSIFVWDFAGGAYTTPLTNPWTSSEVFSGGTWITEAAGAVVVCNSGPITIPSSGAATPYPSDIVVAGQPTSVTDVNVQLFGLAHTYPDDVDFLLVGPQGENLIVMSDAGNGNAITAVDLVLDDAAAGALPDAALITSGTYLPTNYGTPDTFPAPAPTPSAATTLATFNGTDPNGTWSLYVFDDAGGDLGSVAGGWCLELSAEVPQLPPDIDVDPLSMTTTQPQNVVTQQTLTIANTGDDDLVWAILEDEGAPEMVDWSDSFDSYATGSQLHGQGGWKGWANDPAAGALTSSAQARSVPNSAAILGASDLVHEYAGYTAGQWTYTAWQYVPTAFTGTSYFILLNSYNDAGTGLNWSVQVSFDASTNLVTNDGPAGGTLPLVRDQWVELRNEIDLDLDTQSFYYNGALLFSTTWTGGMSGGGALNIGAVDLFANGSSVIYYDDFSLVAMGIPAACDLPSDVPWLSTAPSNGTTAGGASTPVQVSFDSTGLAVGSYSANLCVTSNDPDPGPGNGTDLVIVPVELNVAAGTNPSISLVKTVGTTPGVCATTSTITVAAGTTVYYCYEVTNTGDVTFTTHDLVDDQLGTIFTGLAYTLTPGASVNTVQAGLSIAAVIDVTTINNAVWVASVAGGPSAQATASATVNVGGVSPAIELTKTVGTVPGVCATTDTITVATGTEVYYCYQVENTGDVTLEVHDLVDDQLGTILDNFAYTLAPGAFSPQVIEPATITGPVVNTGTWTATGLAFAPTSFNFIDISATGTPLNLTDDSEANITLPFSFTLFGVSSSDLRVGNNGGILFGVTTGDLGTSNTALPNATIGRAILPFWDDIDADTGNVYWAVQGSAPNRVAIVEWYNRPHYSNVGSATFEVLLYEGTNVIVFQYLDMDFGNPLYDFGASATVGLNESASNALQYSFNQAIITDGLALTHDPALYAIASSSDSATVNIADPDINVTPASMAASLLIGTTETQVLSIGNVGTGTLDWNIDEAPAGTEGVRFPPMPNMAGPGDAAVAQEQASDFPAPKPPEWIPALGTWAPPEAVIYDNGPIVTHPGGGAGGADASALQTAIGMNTYGAGNQVSAGNRVADDFTVAGGGGWYIDTITFFEYQTGSTTTSTFTAMNLRIWNGPPDDPGSVVVWGDTTTNVMTSSTWSNIYRVLDTALTNPDRPVMANVVTVGTLLPAGTYWLDWQADGTLASGPWQPPITILGQTTTGNAKQYTSTGWADLTDSGTLTPQGLPFIIEGTASECSSPADVPWLSVSPAAGTTAPGGTTPVDVTFDATATPIGTYDALLCVFSNDPDEPLIEVPVTMEVVIPVELMGISVE